MQFTIICSALVFISGVALAQQPLVDQLPWPDYTAKVNDIEATEPLLNVSESAQVVGPDNFRLDFEIAGLLPSAGDEEDDRRSFSGKIDCVDGVWYSNRGKAGRYNTATHAVNHAGLHVDDDNMSGGLQLVIKPDKWVPADGKEREILVTVDAEIKRSDSSAPESGDATESRWWHIMAGDAAAPAFEVNGTCSFLCIQSGQEIVSPFSGMLSQPVGVNKWSTGYAVNGGVVFDFNMGTNRVNWNHARLAQAQFDPVRDLSEWDGLRISVETDHPRNDTGVSLWLAEEDGSWYYLKNAIPLSAATNTVLLHFEDFAEAEWVSPSSHVDEDYVLDLASIARIGIGVINPLGVGDVSFSLKDLDLVRLVKAEKVPAELVVSGKTMAVNDTEMVPPGLFGGFAPHLPQRYRPGCQRDLRTLPGGGVSIPRINHYRLRNDDLPDPLALIDALDQAMKAEEASLLKHITSLFSERTMRRWPEQQRSKIKTILNQNKNDFRELTDPLNDVLRNADFYQLKKWPEDVTKRIAPRFKPDLDNYAELNYRDRFVINRALLSAALPGLVADPPENEPTEAFYIDTMGDRYQACPVVKNPGSWRDNAENFGRKYAASAKAAEQTAVMEIWNEPYLNWATRPGEHYKTKYYNESLAEEGGEVTLRDTDIVIPHLRWRKNKEDKWEIYDETQFSYWSGRANEYIYNLYAEAVASAVKKENKDTRVVAGWGFRWNEDHWAAWDMLYRPTIDKLWKVIDGLSEHHYQGDTTAMNGSYEVATAYGMTQYGKWLYSYNTETSDLLDVPARGNIETPEMVNAAKDYRRMTYNMRDILYCILQSPDKIRGRTVIHYDQTRAGMDVAYGGILLNLRGRLVETASDDPDIWVVSSIDGTDPDAMPPDESKELVVVVFNNHRESRKMNLKIKAPDGTVFSGSPVIQRTALEKDTMRVSLDEQKVKIKKGTEAYETVIDLNERSAWKITLPLDGTPPDVAQVQRRQFFAPELLAEVKRDQPFEATVTLDRKQFKQAQRAWLRLVVEDVLEGEAQVMVGGKSMVLPRAITADNMNRIIELPLDVASLERNNKIRFTVNESFPGYRIPMTSIVLESRL